MKIKNINKKVLAGIIGFTILTTPLGLTACGHELNETKNSYEDVNDYVMKITIDELGQSGNVGIYTRPLNLVSGQNNTYQYFIKSSRKFFFQC